MTSNKNLSPSVREQLLSEVAIADRASKAYKIFIKNFCEVERLDVFNQFCRLDPSDLERLHSIKLRQMSIDLLDDSIQEVINTGKMASETLQRKD